MSDLQNTYRPQASHFTKRVPEGAGQHATALLPGFLVEIEMWAAKPA
jgi:hypothetical protein